MSAYFFKEISLKLRNSWNPNESVLSPHAAEKNCVKAEELTGGMKETL